MKYNSIKAKLTYWIEYTGTGDSYRKVNDQDCILTNGNLYADTLFSLWLPLRYTLNHYNCNKWIQWKEHKTRNLKGDNECLQDIHDNIEDFLPESDLSKLLEELFSEGNKRSNVVILPYRKWNTQRGRAPYYDYMPHFLYDLLNTENEFYIEALKKWIEAEHLYMFFIDGKIQLECIKDLIGTGNVTKHNPNIFKEKELNALFNNYLSILKERSKYFI